MVFSALQVFCPGRISKPCGSVCGTVRKRARGTRKAAPGTLMLFDNLTPAAGKFGFGRCSYEPYADALLPSILSGGEKTERADVGADRRGCSSSSSGNRICSISFLYDGEQGLKYCPICYMEDMEKYGEPYWRREHQIPLMQLCPAHRAPLVKYPIQYTKLSDVYIPLASIACEKATARDIRPWEFRLTDVLMDLLTFPYGYGPEPGMNALETSLHKMELVRDRFQKDVSLSIEKVYNAISAYYGEEISQSYFSKQNYGTIYKLCNWGATSPERYALLSVLAGLSAAELFAVKKEYEDPALACLKKYQASGVLYRKSELADLIGISPARLNSLARKYGIAPFWKQCKTTGARRTHCVRIMLSPEEKSLLYRAVKASGNGQTAVFARTVVLDKAVEIIKKNKKNEPY